MDAVFDLEEKASTDSFEVLSMPMVGFSGVCIGDGSRASPASGWCRRDEGGGGERKCRA
jgi:hypothetical protein